MLALDCWLYVLYIYARKAIHLSALAFCCAWKTTSNTKNISPGTVAIYCTLCASGLSFISKKKNIIKGKRIVLDVIFILYIVKWRQDNILYLNLTHKIFRYCGGLHIHKNSPVRLHSNNSSVYLSTFLSNLARHFN